MDLDILKKEQDLILEVGKNAILADSGKMFMTDIFIIGIMKRSSLLMAGFITLIESNNFLSAVSLIRLHLDSLLQLYGLWLVKNPDDYAKHKISGKNTRDYKDNLGKDMTDNYLKKRFFEDDNNIDYGAIKDVYSETSGLIHFSNKHIFMSIENIEKNNFKFFIGSEMVAPEKEKKEAIYAMYIITQGILRYINSRKVTKESSKQSKHDAH